MIAYYGHDVQDVTTWVTVDASKYYQVLKPLAYQVLQHGNNLEFIAKNDLISMSISGVLNSIAVLYKIDTKSMTGQLVAEYMRVLQRSYPYWVYDNGSYLLVAAPSGDWFSKMLGDEDTNGLEAYAEGRGISINWDPE